MPEPLILNTIDALSRALFATISPATGVRATGTVTTTALPGDDPPSIPRNTYLRPILRGDLREQMLFKTTADWVFDRADSTESGLPITSNIGGARHNLAASTVLRFDPVPEGVAPTVTLDAPMTGGSDEGALLRSVSMFEDLDSANVERDVFAAMLTTPAAMLVWLNSEPAEGALAGLRQGANRASRAARFWKEYFVLYVVAARLTNDTARRAEGLTIVQALTRLLTDRLQNDDGEQLVAVGSGVEILGRQRFRRSERHYVYSIRFRLNQVLEKAVDARTFEKWTKTRYQGALPGGEAPEPIQVLELVDVIDPMPSEE